MRVEKEKEWKRRGRREGKRKGRGPTGEGFSPYGLSYAAVPRDIKIRGFLPFYLRENSVSLGNMIPT